MKKAFSKFFLNVVIVALFLTVLLNHVVQNRSAEHAMVYRAKDRMEQVYQSILKGERELWIYQESLSKDYLVRCRSFAMLIGQNPALLQEQNELSKIQEQLEIDEILITDEKGIVKCSTILDYLDMNFADRESTRDFLEILDDDSVEIVQEVVTNALGKPVQYIGVSRQDQKGIVQIGVSAARLKEAQERNEIPHVLEEVPLNSGEMVFAVDMETNRITTHSDKDYFGKEITELGFSTDYTEKYKNGANVVLPDGRYYCVIGVFDHTAIGFAQNKVNLYREQYLQEVIVVGFMILAFASVYLLVNHFLQKRVISGVLQIMQDMSKISAGKLNTEVKVKGTPEFEKLSQNINDMVKSILDYSGRFSRVIDMGDTPIAAFECFRNVKQVNVSQKFGKMFGLSERRLLDLQIDQDSFMEFLDLQMQNEVEDNPGIYEIVLPDGQERYVRISTMENDISVLGVAMDVTESVEKQNQIMKERDTDPLTQLYNRAAFERKVRRILEKHPEGEMAMAMMDLDKFKGINDNYGHAFGDAYLKHMADIMLSFNGAGYIPGRRSGDEFYIFLYGRKTKEEVAEFMSTFYQELADNKLLFPDGEKRSIGVSSGVAWYQPGREDYNVFLEQADQILYEAKESGRNKYLLEDK